MNDSMDKNKILRNGFWVKFLTIVLIGLNIASIGTLSIPVFLLGDQLAMALFGRLHGDHLWPIGLYMGFLWPLGIPIVYAISKHLTIPKSWSSYPAIFKVLVSIGLFYAWITFLSTLFHLFAQL